MALLSGTTLGPYQIVGLIGHGGMGEVYRARDSKLKRDVAIKVLSDAFAHDTARLARLEREAEILASLNHPRIATIYDVATYGELRCLVMEVVEGEMLSQRIAAGRIAVDEALRIARQTAEALEAAHDKGVIHRDLKPANIKITPDGNVKVLDFGLAKVLRDDATLEDTATAVAMTLPGHVLGTMAYMSPEQAKGQDVDRGSDVWAFGCVLYEMLAGRPAFAGDTSGEILERVFTTDPDWSRLPADTPENIRRLLRHCLQKDRKRRLRDIHDAAVEIEDVAAPVSGSAKEATGRVWQWRAVAASLAIAALMVAATALRFWRAAPAQPEIRFEVSVPWTKDAIRDEGALAPVSPDGLKIVFVAGMGGHSQLWLRSFDTLDGRPLAETDRAEMPFWSPDGRSVGFFADSEMKRVDLDGGALKTLAHAEAGSGGTWGRDGTIVFSTNPGRPLQRMSATGGESTAVTIFEAPRQANHGFPQFLPDSRHFLYFVTGSRDASGVYVGQTDRLTSRRLLDADAPAAYSPTGHLLFIRQGTLWAQAFDAERLELRGTAFAVAEHVGPSAALSASAAGPIAYRTRAAGSGQQQFVWVDRSGRETDTVVYANSGGLGASLSRDGHAIVTFKYADGNMDIWSYDVVRRAWGRLTSDSGDDIFPVWSPDGQSVAFGSNRNETLQNLYQKQIGAAPGNEELLLKSPEIKFATDWSADGRFLLYDRIDRGKGGSEIWALPLGGDRKPFAIVRTAFKDQAGQFSPDGKWIAYQSDRDGRFQIYVQAFPQSGEVVMVSTNGGTEVRWNPNGKELFYLAPDGQLMAVPIGVAASGQAVAPGASSPLFATGLRAERRQQYMVSADGRSFVLNSLVEPTGASPATVILNWKPRP